MVRMRKVCHNQGSTVTEILLLVLLLAVASKIISTFILSKSQITKNFVETANEAILFSRFYSVINDVDLHSYLFNPVVGRGTETSAKLAGFDLKVGIQYLRISARSVLKRLTGSTQFCRRGDEGFITTTFLGVGLDGMCVFSTPEAINIPEITCQNIPLTPHRKSLLPCDINENRVILLHPVEKLYLLWVDSHGSLRFTTFDSSRILENQVVIQNSKIHDMSVSYDPDLRSVKITLTGNGLRKTFYSSIPRKDHRQILLDPLL